MSYMSKEDLERIANGQPWSQMDGNAPNSYYTGLEDEWVHFRGRPNGSFMREYDDKHRYELTFINSNSATVELYLNLSYAGDEPGVEGFIDEGEIESLTMDNQSTPQPYLIEVQKGAEYPSLSDWMYYHREHPTNWLSMRMSYTNPSQRMLGMSWNRVDPYNRHDPDVLRFKDHVDPDQHHQDMLDIPVSRMINDEERIRIQIAGAYNNNGSTVPNTVTITLYLGAEMNPKRAFLNKTLRGRSTAMLLGGANAVTISSGSQPKNLKA